MINYDPGRWGIVFACTLKGSVFPKAAVWAVPCSLVAIALHVIVHTNPDMFDKLGAGDVGASVLTGFTFILGFLVVFRSQQAYARWWEGGTLLQQLRGEWFNAFSSLMAFCNTSPEKEADVLKFQHKLARLCSLLYCTAIQQVSTMKVKDYELIDIEEFDRASMEYMMTAPDRCEVCLQWIQRLIGDANEAGVLKVAPPILSRVYNQLGNGIVNLNNARKITEFPIPFPLAQMIAFMLLFHWVITAFICAASVERSFWAGVLSFIVTFSFWSINYIAVELEQPFGDDANDLPLYEMQADLNASIRSLMDSRAQHPPKFNFRQEHKLLRARSQTMEDIFANHSEKEMTATSLDTMAASPDNEKSSGNGMVLQAATAHGARPKENSMQMSCEPPVTVPSVTPEVWFHMSPNDSMSTWRQDVEASCKAQSLLSVAPLHNAVPLNGSPTLSPQLHNALLVGGAPTVSLQASPLPGLPLQLPPPPVWEPSPLSATLTLADSMLGAPTNGKPRPSYRAADISTTTTHDAEGLPGRLQALQAHNDAASFPAALAAPSTVWGFNEHGTSY